jgi:ribosomal protein S15P/S13E
MLWNGKEVTSIHPRSNYGENHFTKVNTASKPDKARVLGVIQSIREHLGRHPHDCASQGHIKKLEAKLNG